MGKRGRLCRRGTWIEGGGSPRAHPKEYTDRGMGRSRVHLLQDRPPNELFTTGGELCLLVSPSLYRLQSSFQSSGQTGLPSRLRCLCCRLGSQAPLWVQDSHFLGGRESA